MVWEREIDAFPSSLIEPQKDIKEQLAIELVKAKVEKSNIDNQTNKMKRIIDIVLELLSEIY